MTETIQQPTESKAAVMQMLLWPFTNLFKQVAEIKERYHDTNHERIKEQICEDIRITDTYVDGRIVVALTVHGVVVDYVRHHDDTDPEGYLLVDGTSELISRMQHIRINEYARQVAK